MMTAQTAWISTVARLAISTALLMWSSDSLAQTRTWDGNGTPDNSGNWSDAVNWDGPDNIPDTIGENASLPNVSSGTRTVTVNTSTVMGQLLMTQSSTSGTNKLLLSAPLTLFTNSVSPGIPFSLTASAGKSNLVIDLNGQSLVSTNYLSSRVYLDGTMLMGPGSSFTIHYGSGASSSHSLLMQNNGLLFQDGSSLVHQLNATSTGGTPSNRDYGNTGTWILTNRASFTIAGYQVVPTSGIILYNCTNSGTMRVVGASTNTVRRLQNLGTLELGNDSLLGYVTTASTGDGTVNNRGSLMVSGTNAIIGNATTSDSASSSEVNNYGSMMVGINGNPAELIIKSGTTVLSNAVGGVLSTVPGSRIILRCIANQGVFVFNNMGIYTQDNSSILFDYAPTNVNQTTSSYRDYLNSGTWVLKNGAVVGPTSSTSRTSISFLMKCNNSGSLEVLSGSRMMFRSLTNSGSITLGDNVMFGDVFPSGIYDRTLFNNGTGSIRVTGSNAVCGWTNYNGSSTYGFQLLNGWAGSGGATLTVGEEGAPASLSIYSDTASSLINFAGNTVTVSRASTLGLKDICTVATTGGNGSTILTNAGCFVLGGTLVMQPNKYGTDSIDNTGSYLIGSGNMATGIVQLLPGVGSGNSLNPMTFHNYAGATLAGGGLLVYSNSSGSSARDTLTMDNYGTISPGAPVGTLEIANTSLTNYSGKLSVQLYSSSVFDKLKLTGTGAGYDLSGAGDVLDVSLVDRYRWTGATTFRIVEAPVLGTFDTRLWNGAPVAGQYTVNYGANYIDIVVRGPNGSMVIVR